MGGIGPNSGFYGIEQPTFCYSLRVSYRGRPEPRASKGVNLVYRVFNKIITPVHSYIYIIIDNILILNAKFLSTIHRKIMDKIEEMHPWGS
ncbi:MAG: hypothetical protein CMM25_07700 [Rhodospirillaceae bacterium]|nr:hypothetical protein [Rhodospirillaceae bacterium]